MSLKKLIFPPQYNSPQIHTFCGLCPTAPHAPRGGFDDPSVAPMVSSTFQMKSSRNINFWNCSMERFHRAVGRIPVRIPTVKHILFGNLFHMLGDLIYAEDRWNFSCWKDIVAFCVKTNVLQFYYPVSTISIGPYFCSLTLDLQIAWVYIPMKR